VEGEEVEEERERGSLKCAQTIANDSNWHQGQPHSGHSPLLDRSSTAGCLAPLGQKRLRAGKVGVGRKHHSTRKGARLTQDQSRLHIVGLSRMCFTNIS